jgi:hypothetical protein
MNPHNLAKALLELDAREGTLLPDPRELTHFFLRRDRRRVRLLAGVTVLLWLLAAAGLFLLVLGLHWYIRSVRIQEFEIGGYTKRTTQAGDNKRPRIEIQPYLETGMLHHSIGVIAGSVVALFLAAFSTVFLVLSSRQATLRQLNASLIEISEHLKLMRQAAGGEAPS